MHKDVCRRKLKEASSLTHLFFLKATAKVEQTILRTKADTIRMDVELKAKLEAVRQRTPRYLFRLWSNSEEETPNGGFLDLNTTTAITPLAFSRGKGHKSAYHMTKSEFTQMAYCHLHTHDHIETEFSSWSASLTFILNKCPGVGTGGVKLASRSNENLHISVIDTKWLWDTNQVFYAPLLDFLDPGEFGYPHEYLLHGVVQGRWYKAIAFSTLLSSPGLSFSSDWYFHSEEVELRPLTKEIIETARTAAELFGETWTLPIMLAILCCRKRNQELWRHGIDESDVQKILNDMQGLRVPQSWKTDKTITRHHFVSSKNYNDTKQLTRLMRALVKRTQRKSKDNPSDSQVSEDEQSVYGDGTIEDGTTEIEPECSSVETEAMREDDTDFTGFAAQKESNAVKSVAPDGSKKSRRKGKQKEKVVDETDRVGKGSDAVAAARAIWQRRHGTGRLTKLMPGS